MTLPLALRHLHKRPQKPREAFQDVGQGIVTRRAETRSSRGLGRPLPTIERSRPLGRDVPTSFALAGTVHDLIMPFAFKVDPVSPAYCLALS